MLLRLIRDFFNRCYRIFVRYFVQNPPIVHNPPIVQTDQKPHFYYFNPEYVTKELELIKQNLAILETKGEAAHWKNIFVDYKMMHPEHNYIQNDMAQNTLLYAIIAECESAMTLIRSVGEEEFPPEVIEKAHMLVLNTANIVKNLIINGAKLEKMK